MARTVLSVRRVGPGIWTAVLFVATGVMAGCAGEDGGAELDGSDTIDGTETPTVDFTESTGAIVGTVYNQEKVAAAGVRIDLVGRGRFTLSDITGHYKFIQLEPGRYELTATAGENEPAREDVEVAANKYAHLDFDITLSKPTELIPYYSTVIERGFIGCGVKGTDCPSYPGNSNNKKDFEHHFDGAPIGFLYEVVWDQVGVAPPPATPPAWNPEGQPGWIQRLEISAALGSKSVGVNHNPPYMYTHVNFTGPQDSAPGSPGHIRVDTFRAGGLESPGYAFETDFELYMTAFYVDDRWAEICAVPPDQCPTLPREPN